MVNDKTLAEKLEAKRRQLEKTKKTAQEWAKKAETQEAELRGFEEAARFMGADSDASQDSAGPPTRGLSGAWKAVIAHMATKHPQEFTLAEIGALAAANSVNAQPETIRSQMHGYASDEKKYVERTAPGTYRATAAGADAADVTLGGRDDQKETAGTDEVPAVT